MVMTEDDAVFLFSEYSSKNKELALYITEECNIQCEICYMDAQTKKKAFITKDIIKKAIDIIDSSYVLTLYGGEPSLNLKLCKYAIELAHAKGIKVRMATNGTCSIRKLKKLDLDYLSVGINDFHHVSQKHLQKLLTVFSSDKIKTKIMVNGLEGHTDMSVFVYDRNMFIMYDEVSLYGRGYIQSKVTKVNETRCSSQGIAIRPNGEIIGFCRRGKNACKFGNVFDKDVSKKLQVILKRRPIFKLQNPTWNNYFCVPGSMNNEKFDVEGFKLTVHES